ncbi:MAG: hypothetical protein LUC98_04650, partial [Lachnospiraceae bacterium]|nr:hypothetical protein [Lachnospiraceae bacterium]
NRMEPQVPEEEMELADEKLEGASGGGKESATIFVKSDGLCPDCQVAVKRRKSDRKWYCPSCNKIASFNGA